MITKPVAQSSLEFIFATLQEVLVDDPAKRDLVKYHVAESIECAKTMAVFLDEVKS